MIVEVPYFDLVKIRQEKRLSIYRDKQNQNRLIVNDNGLTLIADIQSEAEQFHFDAKVASITNKPFKCGEHRERTVNFAAGDAQFTEIKPPANMQYCLEQVVCQIDLGTATEKAALLAGAKIVFSILVNGFRVGGAEYTAVEQLLLAGSKTTYSPEIGGRIFADVLFRYTQKEQDHIIRSVVLDGSKNMSLRMEIVGGDKMLNSSRCEASLRFSTSTIHV